MELSTVLNNCQVFGTATHEAGKGDPQLNRMLCVPPSLAHVGWHPARATETCSWTSWAPEDAESLNHRIVES